MIAVFIVARISMPAKHHQKFLIVVSTRLKMVREGIAAVKDSLPIWSHYLRQYETYGIAHPFEWDY